MAKKRLSAVSLFSSAGIGELALVKNGIDIVVANELLTDRCALYKENFPETEMFEGDIWKLKDKITNSTLAKIGTDELFLVYSTPPCQGMSTNGAGKIKAEIAAGNRSHVDERNRLVIPALDIIVKLRPKWVLFENVPSMKDTAIQVNNQKKNIVEYIAQKLGKDYKGGAAVVKCSDFGVPQLRRRLITVFTRDENGKRYLDSNNGKILSDDDKEPTNSLWDAIGKLPSLDAKEGKNSNEKFHPLHYVNVMDPEKYWWVSNTPEGETAYNNQCVNDACLYQGNIRHADRLEDGKWIASKETPFLCKKCGSLLPRPTMIDKKTGKRRLIRGFHSAYRRMDRNLPARALTINFPFEASDNKIHPTQNRVLSFYEALLLQTITNYEYSWSIRNKPITRGLIAQVIGESVPPKLIDKVIKKMINISKGTIRSQSKLGI